MVATREPAIWGIHSGRTGEADSLFLKHNMIALGWDKMGDLATLPSDREAFKVRVAKVYIDHKPGAVPNLAGQMFRFVHEMHTGDLVVYPSKSDRQVHIGRVEGLYTLSNTWYNEQENKGGNGRERYWKQWRTHESSTQQSSS